MVQFNQHGKKEYPPMHTVEHIVNAAMVKLFGTGRSVSAHVERKKSRMDFLMEEAPTEEEVKALEDEINRVIQEDKPVSFLVTTQSEATKYGVDLSRIPDNATDMVRLAMVGDYDICLCIGDHVEHTAQCGRFILYSHAYNPDTKRWRLRFKLEGEDPIFESNG